MEKNLTYLDDFVIEMQNCYQTSRGTINTLRKFESVIGEYGKIEITTRDFSAHGIILPLSFFGDEYMDELPQNSSIDFMGREARACTYSWLIKRDFVIHSKRPCLFGYAREVRDKYPSREDCQWGDYSWRGFTRKYNVFPQWVFFDLKPNSRGYSAREYLEIRE